MERIFEAPNGVRVIATNDIQADVYEREEGFKEVTEPKKKK